MEEILKSILETEKQAEAIIAEAKLEAQKISQAAGESVEASKSLSRKEIQERVEATLSKIRREAATGKEKILAEAGAAAQALERQAQARLAKAVEVALKRLLATSYPPS